MSHPQAPHHQGSAEQILAGRDWWLRNRDKAPLAFDEDLDELFDQLEDAPDLVGRALGQDRRVRRAYLPRIRYYVSFRILKDQNRVEILTLWHGSRQPPHWWK